MKVFFFNIFSCRLIRHFLDFTIGARSCKWKSLSKRPEALNLLGIYSSLSNQSLNNTINEFSGKNFSEFKKKFSSLVIDKVSPISSEMNKLIKDEKFIDDILKDGTEKANEIAQRKIQNIKKIIGF